jgi:hypothetical protein
MLNGLCACAGGGDATNCKLVYIVIVLTIALQSTCIYHRRMGLRICKLYMCMRICDEHSACNNETVLTPPLSKCYASRLGAQRITYDVLTEVTIKTVVFCYGTVRSSRQLEMLRRKLLFPSSHATEHDGEIFLRHVG